ncbi:MAG TPA: bifunctional methionine sulfoxide reductase B/A protein [Spirochaetota bacterium]|nr:bifunctional methionine sulfoxide reductase B/A protein [Spirochaetota bacterium]
MKNIYSLCIILTFAAILAQCGASSNIDKRGDKPMNYTVTKSDIEWKTILTPEQYRVMREGGTERPFSGPLNDNYRDGTYFCPGCGTALFSSATKYDHRTGWPSFTAPIDRKNIEYRQDTSHGMVRTEVRCAACGAHLGHVFDDGPAPAREHYCINSASLKFEPAASDTNAVPARYEKATFAAGCFWGVEHTLGTMKGVKATSVGYIGGRTANPTYEQVCSGATGHAEAVEVTFDPSVVSYNELLAAFFALHNPTTLNRQGPDVGEQYRSAIFYHTDEQKKAAEAMIRTLTTEKRFKQPIVTQIVPAGTFFRAEEYHQKYHEKRGGGSCAF